MEELTSRSFHPLCEMISRTHLKQREKKRVLTFHIERLRARGFYFLLIKHVNKEFRWRYYFILNKMYAEI